MKKGLYYWIYSLRHPESLIDKNYIYDQLIISPDISKKTDISEKAKKLRELISSFCCLNSLYKEKKQSDIYSSLEIVKSEILHLLLNTDFIQYTEFVAFWKTLDISLSSFLGECKVALSNINKTSIDTKDFPQKIKDLLGYILEEYCKKRKPVYDIYGYTDTIMQALYDSGFSRRKGGAFHYKIEAIINDVLSLEYRKNSSEEIWYLFPEKDKEMFGTVIKDMGIKFDFGSYNQNKYPDLLLKVGRHILIIEAKHLKEEGGAQNRSVNELISFIRYSEKSTKNLIVHYGAFIDGTYFNKFIDFRISKKKHTTSKIGRQFYDICNALLENPYNFFVNTEGLKKILIDLKAEYDDYNRKR